MKKVLKDALSLALGSLEEASGHMDKAYVLTGSIRMSEEEIEQVKAFEDEVSRIRLELADWLAKRGVT